MGVFGAIFGAYRGIRGSGALAVYSWFCGGVTGFIYRFYPGVAVLFIRCEGSAGLYRRFVSFFHLGFCALAGREGNMVKQDTPFFRKTLPRN